jgi:hypothetical protein
LFAAICFSDFFSQVAKYIIRCLDFCDRVAEM